MTENGMITQVQSLPALIREEMDTLDGRVRRLLNHNEILSTKRIITTGCGRDASCSLWDKVSAEILP